MYQLKPLSLGEVLDVSFTLFRRQFGAFMLIAAVCSGPGALIRIYAATSGGMALHPYLALLYFLVSFLGSFVGTGATVRLISALYLEQEPSVKDALLEAMSKWGALVMVAFGTALVTGLGMLLLVIPGIIFWCGLCLASQVVVLESASGSDAMSRSWRLTSGYRFKVFLAVFVVIMVLAVPAGALAVFISDTSGEIVGTLLGLLLMPLFYIVGTVLYYDLRVRKEGFDLELLGRLTGESSAAA